MDMFYVILTISMNCVSCQLSTKQIEQMKKIYIYIYTERGQRASGLVSVYSLPLRLFPFQVLSLYLF